MPSLFLSVCLPRFVLWSNGGQTANYGQTVVSVFKHYRPLVCMKVEEEYGDDILIATIFGLRAPKYGVELGGNNLTLKLWLNGGK